MKSFFTSQFFAGNRQKLRELVDDTPIIIPANGLLQKGADTAYAFSQDANFWYLTGIDEPDLVLVIDGQDDYLIVPSRSAIRMAFDGSPNEDALTKRSGIKTIYDDKTGWELLAKRLKKVKQIAGLTVPPAYVERYGIYTNPARATLVEHLKTYNTKLEILELNQQLARLRMIKQPEELAAIQAAIDITVATIIDTTKPAKLRRYSYEYEIEAELSHGYRQQGAAGHAFDPIVAGGKRAVTLHYVANNGALAKGKLLLIDTGAEVEHYAADITRTISLGRLTGRQRAVYTAVLEVQQSAFDILQPGVQIKEYEQQVEHVMGEKLIELGLIKTNSHEAVRKYYPHATSHFLGLNVHDVGDYNQALEPGVVMTVEPGIYIPEEGIGVRIEDDVLITKYGNRVLTTQLSRDLR